MSQNNNQNKTHQIIMPALGMAQDFGEIVVWHKQVGDVVKPNDVLMEVETDKATMEIEAGFAGIVTDIRAEVGTSVPVGEIIAVLSESSGEGTSPITVQNTNEIDDNAKTLDALKKKVVSSSGPVSNDKATTDNLTVSQRQKVSAEKTSKIEDNFAQKVKVLASPKVKLAAYKQGVNLTSVLRGGVSQPIQFADLESYVARSGGGARARSQLQARVPAEQFTQLVSWVMEVSEGAVTSACVWCMFAAAALRNARNQSANDDVLVRCESWIDRQQDTQRLNADMSGLLEYATVEPERETLAPDLVIRDMTGTSLVGYIPAEIDADLSISIINEGAESMLLCLSFDEEQLSLTNALVLLQQLGERVEQPLRHLL